MLVANTARVVCKSEYVKRLETKTVVIKEQVSAGNPGPLWELSQVPKRRKKRPKIAAAPVIDGSGKVITSYKAMAAVWI